ncbi:MAG: hypothetical protein K5761_07700, partial [Clostridiales bacterium]|nr:hypothetical protein [Clostridiales bacterium]
TARTGEISPLVRDAVNEILDNELKNAIELIEKHKNIIDAFVEKLLADNRMTKTEIKELFDKNMKYKDLFE